eukprot:5368017-Prymnesium_polylepis.1
MAPSSKPTLRRASLVVLIMAETPKVITIATSYFMRTLSAKRSQPAHTPNRSIQLSHDQARVQQAHAARPVMRLNVCRGSTSVSRGRDEGGCNRDVADIPHQSPPHRSAVCW